MDRSITALLNMKQLRSLELSDSELFHRGDGPDSCEHCKDSKGVKPRDIVRHCKPLLVSLNARIAARNLNYTILDVLQVTMTNGWVCATAMGTTPSRACGGRSRKRSRASSAWMLNDDYEKITRPRRYHYLSALRSSRIFC